MYFDKHIFFCLNERAAGETCCANFDSCRLQAYTKDKIKAEQKLNGMRVRVNRAGCLDRCDFGPVLVIYPEGIWYSYLDEEDIDEIIQSHLIKGVLVERLRIKG